MGLLGDGNREDSFFILIFEGRREQEDAGRSQQRLFGLPG